MNKKNYTFLISILVITFINLAPIAVLAFGSSDDTVGKIIVKADDAYVNRSGSKMTIGAFGLILKKGDQVVTNQTGKAHIILDDANDIFLGPSSKLLIDKSIIEDKDSTFSGFFLTLFGKLRAKVKKSKQKSLEVRTATAVIGVKGTDFVVEHVGDITTVGTLKGLVNLKSILNPQEVDIPPGKMSSVSASGEVLPLEEFAGRLLTNMEFAGEQMEEGDYSGEKVEF